MDDFSMISAFGEERRGGILLHPTSLPSKYGIGDFGCEIFRFIDYLYDIKQNLWQVLPLGPTGYGDSPYQCLSSFAGNPFLISPDNLINLNLIEPPDIEDEGLSKSLSRVNFGKVIPFKWKILRNAFLNFQNSSNSLLKEEYGNFKKRNSYWLDEYSLFMSIKLTYNQEAWDKWEDDLRLHESKTIEKWKTKLDYPV